MSIPEATRPGLEPDVPAIVHEELDRLPDRHRLPVVLCDLEGLTYEQAAAHLRWTEPTLRHRLVKARHRLRERLTRRGITAGSVGVVLAASGGRGESGGARGPGSLGGHGGDGRREHGDGRRPVGRPHQEPDHDQAEGRRGECPGRGRGRDGRRGRGRGGAVATIPRPAIDAQAGAEMKRPAAAGQTPAPASAPGAMIEVRGRVVDPQGRSVPGATVQAVYIGVNGDIKPAPGSSGLGRPVPAARAAPALLPRLPARRCHARPRRHTALDHRVRPGIRARQGRGPAQSPATRPS